MTLVCQQLEMVHTKDTCGDDCVMYFDGSSENNNNKPMVQFSRESKVASKMDVAMVEIQNKFMTVGRL